VINIETLREMNTALTQLRDDPEVAVVVITGAGERAFSAGVEVKEHMGEMMPTMMTEFTQLFRSLMAVDKPTIAVVNGVALGGGCEVVAWCDLAIASDRAQFAQPEIKLAVCPPAAVPLFPKIMGRKKAFELITIGDNIDAKEAERIGLVNKVVPQEELQGAAEEFIARISEKSPVVLKMVRRALYEVCDLDLAQALEVADEYGRRIMETEDATEGLTAFLEKRKPAWKNK
jgi:cyclohexa-1,5-dienecarbonyl-CoA hydratase